MRLESDKELEQEADEMFLQKHHQLGSGIFPPTVSNLSRDYVRQNQKRFKYAEDVTADIMAGFVIQKGYVEELKNSEGKTYHVLTEKGKDFVQKNKDV